MSISPRSHNPRHRFLLGSVSAPSPLLPSLLSEAGKELTVQGTSTTSEYVGEPADIDYDSLPDIIKEYIEEVPAALSPAAPSFVYHAVLTPMSLFGGLFPPRD